MCGKGRTMLVKHKGKATAHLARAAANILFEITTLRPGILWHKNLPPSPDE
jgi:hypothetical protein